MSRPVAISVEGLSKRYVLEDHSDVEYGGKRSELWALKDINLEVHKGESLGIIGKNGSGKSTLLKIISSISKPTEGRVTIDGRVASILGIGAGFHPDLNGMENIFLHGRILGFSRTEIKEKLDDIIKFSEIEKFIYEPVKNYSDGMYLRLAFSIMAELEADIYLFDEVISVGDTKFQRKCLRRLDELVVKGKTVVIVSHALSQVQEFLDTVVVLDKGVVENHGPARKLIDQYLDKSMEDEPEEEFDRPNRNLVVWHEGQRPGIDSMKVIDFELKQNGDAEWRVDKPLRAKIRIETADTPLRSEIAICLSDILGNIILIDSPDLLNNRPDIYDIPGVFTLTFTLPANTLNQRTQCVGIMMGNEHGELVYKRTNLFVMDMKGKPRMGPLADNSGALNPFLKWHVE